MKKILKIITMLFVIAAVVFAAGCTEKSEPVTENNTTENNTTQANETVETGQIVTEADNGTSISLKNGENFTLQLRENPSTGYSWQLNVSKGLTILSDGYTQDEAPEGKVGVPGNRSWVIEAVDQGQPAGKRYIQTILDEYNRHRGELYTHCRG